VLAYVLIPSKPALIAVFSMQLQGMTQPPWGKSRVPRCVQKTPH